MALLFDRQKGVAVDVPDEQASEAVASGRFLPQRGQVGVISANGEPGTIDAEHVQEAISKYGYRLETTQEGADRQFGDSEVVAGAAAAARGATLGLSDAILTKTGLVSPKTLEGLELANPGASIAGEVGGALAGLLVPGEGEVNAAKVAGKLGRLGERGAAKLLGKSAKTLAGRLATKGAGAALEGSLYGAGHAISQAAIHDEELTGEKLLAEAGMGTLIGFGGGAAGEALGLAAGKALQVGRELAGGAGGTIQQGLREFAANRAVKATGAIQSNLNKLRSPELAQEIGGDLLDLGIVTAGKSQEEIRTGIRAALKEQGEKVGGTLRQVDAATGGKAFDLSGFLAKARTDVVDELASDPVLSPLAKKIEKQLNRFEGAAEGVFAEDAGVGFEQANKWKGSLQKTIKKWTDSDATQEANKKLQAILDDEIEKQLAARGVDLEAFKESKRLYGNLKEAAKWGRRGADAGLGNRALGMSDTQVGQVAALLTGGPAGIATGVAGAFANKVLRERASQVFADVANRLAESPALARISTVFERSISGALKDAPAKFGAYTGILANAAASGARTLMATHAALAETDPGYADTMAKAGYPLESPEDAQALGRKAERLDALERAVERHDQELDAAVSGFMKGGGMPAARATGSLAARLKAFEKQSELLSKLAENPAQLANRMVLGKALDDAPGVAASATAAATRGVEFLNAKLPRPPAAPISPAVDRPWRPSDLQLGRFERYVAAVNDPRTVLQDMQRGTVSKEAVEALKAVYPKLAEDIRGRFLSQLAEAKGRMDYRRRMQLEQLFGEPLGDPGAGSRYALLQASLGTAAQANAQQQQQRRGGKAPDVAKGLQTGAQRIEARGEST